MPRAILFLLTSLFSVLAQPYEADLTHAELELAAANPQWRALLHMHNVGLSFGTTSQVDDARFFLDDEGKHDPLAELRATLDLFTATQHQESPRACRFQARRHWLLSRWPQLTFTPLECSEYEQWLNTLQPESLSFVYPAAYLNSPSSMFGHTFIRINRENNDNPLLDWAVNFAADAQPSEDEWLYAIKGLTGGYAGQFSVMPYYQKVNEYSFLESRDIWEYDIPVDNATLMQFVRHIWELRDINFDYFFFTENCSYQLLTALDAANADWALSADFRSHAIPVDTMRSMITRDLLVSPVYRASALSKLKSWSQSLSIEEHAAVENLSNPERDIQSSLQTLASAAQTDTVQTTTRQARALEFAYHLMRFRAVKDERRSKAETQHALRLLSARSKLGVLDTFAEPAPPAVRDEDAHASHRWGLGFGHDATRDRDYVDLSLRAAYHDLLDPAAGFGRGTHLEMFNIALRTDNVSSGFRLQHLNLIRIQSLRPVDQHFSPWSWGISAALTRDYSASQDLQAQVLGSGGKTWAVSDNYPLHVSALWDAAVTLGSPIAHQPDISSGPGIKLWLQNDQFSVLAEGYHHRVVDEVEDHYYQGATLAFARHLNRNLQARLAVHHQRAADHNTTREYNSFALTLHHYF